MVETHHPQQYMMVSFNFDLSEIDFPHYIRNEFRNKILGLDEPQPGHMHAENTSGERPCQKLG
jgi:hypothetical protein